jgi:hypothetical protein
VLAALAAGAGTGKQRHLVRRAVHHGRIGPENILGAVAVMDVEIDHRGAGDTVFALGVARGDRGVVEEAKAHRLVDLGMMAGRAYRDERVVMTARHHSIGGGDRTADATHHRLPGARRHRGIAVDIDQAARWRDMPEFLDIMLAMAQRDRIETALRRFAAHQGIEPILPEHFANGAQPVGAFRMAGRRGMVEAGLMRKQQCGHATPWRAKRITRKDQSKGSARPGKEPSPVISPAFQFNRTMRFPGAGAIGLLALK